MARHGLVVEIARAIGTESAIVETTLSYRAKKYGRKRGMRTAFTVNIDELEECYSYFDTPIEECLERIESGIANDAEGPAYAISVVSVGGSRVAYVSVSNIWMKIREAL